MLSIPISFNATQVHEMVSDNLLNSTALQFDAPSLNISSLDEGIPRDDLDLSDIKLSMEELIEKYGCISETHVVKTKDDYELKLFRINKGEVSASKPPVFLQHGIFSSSATWVLSKERSLAFKLAEAGYDVWTGNNRGDFYSRANTDLDPDSQGKLFFDYSFYELGEYDAPTQIDYVLEQTGKEKLSYIGHSQGTSQMFSALSFNHGDMQDKLNVFIALAPIVQLKDSPNSMMQTASKIWHSLQWTAQVFHAYEVGNPTELGAMRDFCSYFRPLCNSIHYWFSMCTPSSDYERCLVDHGRQSSGASLRELIHYAQIVSTGEFKLFDYGSDAGNIEKYGSATVPHIPIEDI